MDVYQKLSEMGLSLPEAPAKGGVYSPCKRFGDKLCYVSGCGPSIGGAKISGKLGCEYGVEEGQEFARNCMLNVLAALQNEMGDLNNVACAAKITVFVASADDFTMQPAVANGASGLLFELYGEAGLPSRSAIGVNVLPGNIPVEVEALFEIK